MATGVFSEVLVLHFDQVCLRHTSTNRTEYRVHELSGRGCLYVQPRLLRAQQAFRSSIQDYSYVSSQVEGLHSQRLPRTTAG